jgi:chemotaxis protein methyltransferase CheR
MRSFLEYHDYLVRPGLTQRDRDRELDELFDRLSTRETYFFRESYQLDVLREHLLPRIHEAAAPFGKSLSLWSAGCASGEEAYSLAICVLESGLFDDWQVSIVGSDLSQTALKTAQAGVYGPSSFRGVDERIVMRYFRQEQGRFHIDDSVKKLCSFYRTNLVSADFSAVGGPFHAIFCRNVLIYFTRPRRLRMLQGLAQKLVPGGRLFLGHSESLLDMTTPFVLDKLGGELVYRLKGG